MSAKKFYLILILMISSQTIFSQSVGGDGKTQNEKQQQTEQMEEEVVDGIWELSGYLGKKLFSELGSRLNLDESAPVEEKKKKVVIRVGSFEIERIE